MIQKVMRCLGVLTALTAFTAAPARCDEKVYHIVPAHSRIEFSFRSTLHKVTGEAHRFTGTFSGRTGLLNFIHDGDVIVEAASLDTFHPKRNANMYTMFDSEHFPQIRYHLSDVIGVPAVDGPPGRVTLKGALKICDHEQAIEIPATITETSDGLLLSGSLDVSLKDFDLDPPSVMMVIRVFDAVHIDFTAYLKEMQT